MKSKVLVASLSVFLALVGIASAGSVIKPTIRRGQAKADAAYYLHQNFIGWRDKRNGYLSCGHGRINRYTWSCAVGWESGRDNCWKGRIRVVTERYERPTVYYRVILNTQRC